MKGYQPYLNYNLSSCLGKTFGKNNRLSDGEKNENDRIHRPNQV